MLARIAGQLRVWLGDSIGVSVVEIGAERPLYPEEAATIARAVPKRRAEFSTGRFCAREALAQLGLPPCAIGVGPLRGPIWPAGTTGSITHAAGICAAIAGPANIFRGLGVDLLDIAEAIPVVQAAADILLNPSESDLPAPQCVDGQALRFSAKESVIKAVSKEAGRWLEFSEITVAFGASTFQAVVPADRLGEKGMPLVHGYFVVYDDILLTVANLLVDPR